MCYRIQINTSIEAIAKRFNAVIHIEKATVFEEEVNGFAYPSTPLILDNAPTIVTGEYHWGLIPHYSKDETIRKHTLNARIETLDQAGPYYEVVDQRCLVIATGYYDWRWNDETGKNKEKYIIHSNENDIFTFGGIYSTWRNPQTDEALKTYSIVTTAANKTMQFVHNKKMRMPLMLKQKDEMAWLDKSVPYNEFAYPNYDAGILAFTV